eukprot:CAMPEP_0115511040 /NCGR_PEP_ID=MMETSP0271-20121206/73752_1 /TAXON_ID=71861 /ORGANISM="Scrippsiella trochoidea, Strain CCMP3099" /LENGTH=125 /DNA_ID=CAMNT_0002941081 /DNA_START=245 /DNA_END=624 /DNA_ORIENTATION=-
MKMGVQYTIDAATIHPEVRCALICVTWNEALRNHSALHLQHCRTQQPGAASLEKRMIRLTTTTTKNCLTSAASLLVCDENSATPFKCDASTMLVGGDAHNMAQRHTELIANVDKDSDILIRMPAE